MSCAQALLLAPQLFDAVRRGDVELVADLLQRGADPWLPDMAPGVRAWRDYLAHSFKT